MAYGHNHANQHADKKLQQDIQKFLLDGSIEFDVIPSATTMALADANAGDYVKVAVELVDGNGKKLELGEFDVGLSIDNASNTGSDFTLDDSTVTVKEGRAFTFVRSAGDDSNSDADEVVVSVDDYTAPDGRTISGGNTLTITVSSS